MKSTLQPVSNSTTPSTTTYNLTTSATTEYVSTTTTDHTTATTSATTTLQSTTMLTEPLLTTTAAHTNHLTKTDVVAIAVSIVFMIVFIVGVGICYIRRKQRYNDYVRSRFNAEGDAIFMTDDVIQTHDDVLDDQNIDDVMNGGDFPQLPIQGFDQDEPLIVA